ncbi:ubiquinol-cytochrome c reductase iron-sulfur subunit [Taylorella equigenitalis]|uniref:ubiquinol-cytochrome c reductase iron-sulfur subunit n=1 Tax=Taylorella equigenitalis TaxID=29575 RepID=UPI000405041B|nr:ubiquinol-cytochrome c reductase iron-sulfur subunit [Taylorella equigenitalis]ASY38377.1 ubiquinol-cytochrome c reductase iron-sulfur subunit [Taylorella equigenitalis]KGK33769.1 ubiquinol-cytochrome C reductase [Taylorella equigenitalis]WDU46270.1 ubiquinol-cytochrome c reductase iron-sulfur subunit [Taylorella equigenitalis]
MSQDSNNIVQSDSLSFPEQLPDDPSRRMLLGTACAIGGVATLATLVPFVASMTPSDRARAAGAPVEVDISQIAPGTMIAVEWQGKPVWILHRTPEMIASLKVTDELVADPNSERPGFTPDYAKNQHRSRKDEWFVCVGICTHLGCSPSSRLKEGNAEGMPSSWNGGYLCPCHGSQFDLAGRVFKNQPAPDNLLIPPYYFMDDTHIMVGLEAAA